METAISINDFVWAKMMGSPPWPSIVVEPGPNVPQRPNAKAHWIYFFGSHNYAWVEQHHLSPYKKYKDKFTSVHKSIPFKEAVEEIDNLLGNLEEDPNYKWSIEPFVRKERNRSKRSKLINAKLKSSSSKRPKQAVDNVTNIDTSTPPSPVDTPLDETRSHIKASHLTFGVLGVGIIGSRIVRNLVRSGHKVNMWNRTTQRCTEIETHFQTNYDGNVELKTFLSPRAVLQNSNVVLNCVSDCDVSKKIIQTYFGINNSADEILKEKGFVEVTTVDPETSKNIRDMIEMKGGRYLEAQIQGSKTEASEGKLVILAAGDRSLFFDCQSCFEAIGKSAYYLGDVGYASKMNLILQLIKGICLVGLTEGFALADRCGIPFHIFLTTFKATNMASNYMSGKAEMITNQNFGEVEQSLENMQKDMNLGLELSDKIGQPMELASIANEIFKHCQRFDLGDKDASSVYMRTRF